MTTYDTWELWLEDEHDRGELEQWLTMIAENWQPVELSEPPPTPKPESELAVAS